MNISERLYRVVGLLLIVLLLAPIEDGCQHDKAVASGARKIAVYSARLAMSLTKGVR